MHTYIDKKTGKEINFPDSGPEDWSVVKVQCRDKYKLEVTFANGKVKLVDMNPVIAEGGVFERIKDPSYFRKAHVDYGTVVWDEMLDIAPEYLYDFGVEIKS